MASDIRKWFMKQHDKGNGANAGSSASAAPKPALAAGEKPSSASAVDAQDISARKKTSKYFAAKTEPKDDSKSANVSDHPEKYAAKRKKSGRAEDDDFTSFEEKPASANSKKLKSTSNVGLTLKSADNDDGDDHEFDESTKPRLKPVGRGRGGRASGAAAGSRGRGIGGRGVAVDNDIAEDAKPAPKSAGRGRGGVSSGAASGGRGRGGGGRGGFMNFDRKDPPHKGEKEVPEGAPNCLAGLTFVISGTLDSLEREEAEDLIKRHGGRVTGSVSKKTNFLLADEDIGGRKSEKAKELGVPFMSEDDLFEKIRKSKPAKAPSNENHKSKDLEKLEKSPLKSSPVKADKNVDIVRKNAAVKTPKSSDSSLTKKPVISCGGSVTWTEKYRPKVPNDIIGNQSLVKQLHDWLKQWDDQFLHSGGKGKGKKQADGSKKAVLLCGTPGIGKTTTAKLVSQMLGFEAIEVNASDSRGKADAKIVKGIGGSTANSVKELVSNATLNYSENRSKHLKSVLIMDEVDGMSAGDRGGVADLIASIKISKIPIICICNDRYSQKLKSLVNYCLLLSFRKPTKQQMAKRLMHIAKAEGLQVNEIALEELADRVNGDMRMAVNQLQYMSLSHSVIKYDDIRERLLTSSKDEDISPFTAVDKLFGFNGGKLRMDERIDLSMCDTDLVPLIVQENYINYRPSMAGKDESGVKRMNLLARAADSIADGDVVNVQIRRYRQWQLSQAFSFASSIVPAALMHGNREILAPGERNFNRFGGWLGKNSTLGKNLRLLEDMHSHVTASQQVNIDRVTLRLDYLTLLLGQLTGPLKSMPKEVAVQKVVELMDSYSLSQEDYDTIMELAKFQGHPNPLDGIQPAVKAALTKAYKQGSSSRVVRAADLITLPGLKKAPKKRIAAMLEPVESVPDENGVPKEENDEENSSDAEINDELEGEEMKPQLDMASNKNKGIHVQLDLKGEGSSSNSKKTTKTPAAASKSGGSTGKRKR